jgi:hypothetical protein
MLTRAKHKQLEGTLKTFNPEVGRTSRRKKMTEEDKRDEQEKNFHMVVYLMSDMVEKMYGDYEKRMKKEENKKEAHADDDASVNQGVGGDPPEPLSSPSSSSSYSFENSHHSQHSNHKVIQVDIGGHPPFPTGSKQFSSNFGNLLFLAGFNFRGHFEGLNEGFLRSRFSMISKA